MAKDYTNSNFVHCFLETSEQKEIQIIELAPNLYLCLLGINESQVEMTKSIRRCLSFSAYTAFTVLTVKTVLMILTILTVLPN